MSARFALVLCLTALALCGLPLSAQAADATSKVVRVGYYENEVFQEGGREGAVKTGYAYEYYRKLSEYTGWGYEYVYGSFSELYQMLLDGQVDLLAGLAYREDRAPLIGYPDSPMGTETYDLVKHASDGSVSEDPATLAGHTIGVLDSSMAEVLQAYLDARGVSAELRRFGDYEELFAAFDTGQVDLLAAEGDGAYSRKDAEVVTTFGTSDYYLCVAKRRADLLDELNVAQRQLSANEPTYLNLLHDKYYPLSMSSQALSAGERRWIEEHDTLRVAYLNHYLPYSDTQDGQVNGLVRDLVPRMLESLGIDNIQVTYVGYDAYRDMIGAVDRGEADVAFPAGGGLYYSEESGINLTNPARTTTMELAYKGEYDDSALARIAVNDANDMQYYYILTYFPHAELVHCPSIEACLTAVKRDEATSTVLNGLQANDIMRNSQYSDLSMHRLTHGDARCFGVKIGNEELLRLLNRGLYMVGEEYVVNLAYRYTAGLYTYTLADLLHDHLPLIMLVVAAVMTLVICLLSRDARRSKWQTAQTEQARRDLELANAELEESQRALAEALQAAEHANRAKTTFLNNMSHDIRTPMNAIVGFTALAQQHIDQKELVRDYLDKIEISSQHLLSLINDVLDMSRIESGKMTLEESETHLPKLIHDLRTIIQADMSAKRLDLLVDTQDVIHEDVVVDSLRLNQVLLNILSNAIKFTPAGGRVELRIIERVEDEHAQGDGGPALFDFVVRDNGIGMSQEFQESIFEPFTRERTSTVSGIQGTGLGMAITKNIVDMMGGTITVSSEVGKGSEFVVSLPCKIGVGEPPEPLPDALAGMRVLVIDDDTNTCLTVSSMLRELGLHPDWTTSGKEAVIRAQDALKSQDPFGIYFVDWMLPDLNGVECVRRIRRIVGDDARTIILSAYDWGDIEAEARDAGVNDFVSKPLFLSELCRVLARTDKDTEARPEEALPELQGRRVLLVDDSEMNCLIAVKLLENLGVGCDVVSDGAEGVRRVEETEAGTYDLVLMDVQMPIMDGYEATRAIRQLSDPAKAQIPIVAMTANAFDEDRKASFEAGMDGYLPKPYSVDELVAALQEVLR